MTGPLLPSDPRRLGGIRLLGRLGAGGMGQVYLGRTAGGRMVAVKTVHEHLAAEPEYRERFRREAAAARAVTGAYTAAVLDADPAAALPWLATAYLPGMTLRHTVAAGGPLPPAAVRSLAAALAEAVRAIHAAELVHRDLKPANVLITSRGPRVIDFGIARTSDAARLTGTGSVLGTPGYLAPEQITEAGPLTGACDVFALGAVLAFAATGDGPFGGGPVAVRLHRAVHGEPDLTAVPETHGLRRLIASCLRKDPRRRPAVAAVLDAVADPGAPLWWRAEPVRSLLAAAEHHGAAPEPARAAARAVPGPVAPAGEAADEKRAGDAESAGPAAESAAGYADTTVTGPEAEAGTASWTRGRDGWRTTRPPWAGPARRTVLAASAAAVTALLGYAAATRSERPPPASPALDWDPGLRRGSDRPGELRWRLTPADGTVGQPPLVGPGAVHVRGEYVVHTCDPGSGAPLWQRDVREPGQPGPFWGLAAGVLVARGLGVPLLDARTGEALGDGSTARPDPYDTAFLWSVPGDGLLVERYRPDPVVSQTVLCATSLRTGRLRWKTEWDELPADETAEALPPAVRGAGALVTRAGDPGTRERTYELCRVDTDSGDIRWTHRPDEPVLALVALPGEDRFALLTRSAELHLLHGDRVTRHRLGPALTAGTTRLAVRGDSVLLATADRLYAYGADGARKRWERPSTGPEPSWPTGLGGLSAPVVAGGLLLHWRAAGTLEAVDPAGGRVRWSRALDGVARLPPAVSGTTVYAAHGDACTALRLDTGEPRRTWRLPGQLTGLGADGAGWYAAVGTSALHAYNGLT